MKPLNEVFGYGCQDMSERAVSNRKGRLCPFGNIVPNCTKDRANDPLGVCSIVADDRAAITCPVRFNQDGIVAKAAAEFFFRSGSMWTTVKEVRLYDANNRAAGNIDFVVCHYDAAGKVVDFGSLEIQAVYISGNVRNPFAQYSANPSETAATVYAGTNSPRPDYLSSSRKRLAPQMLFKGGIFSAWGKKQAVAVDTGFFETLPPMQAVEPQDADLMWIVVDVVPSKHQGHPHQLNVVRKHYTVFRDSLRDITEPKPGDVAAFRKTLQDRVDRELNTPPDVAPPIAFP